MADTTSDYRLWHDRIDASGREREPHEQCWTKLQKALVGTHFREKYREKGQPLNLFNNFARVVMPHLMPRDRRILVSVTPKKPGDEYAQSAELQGERVTALMEAARVANEVRKAIRAWFYSAGILKVGFEVRVGTKRVAASQSPGEAVTVDVDRERAGGKEFLDAGLPYATHVSAWNFFPDPMATSLDDARWVAHRLYRSLESVRADPAFAQYAEQLTACDSRQVRADERQAGDRDSLSNDPRLGMVELFEIYDRDARKVITIGGKRCGCEHILRESEWQSGIEGFPFVHLGGDYDPVEGYFWGNAVLAPQADLAVMSDALNKHLIEKVKQSKNLLLYDSDTIKADEVASLKAAQDGDVVPVKGLTSSVKEFTCGQTVREHWEAAAQFQELWERMTGVGDFQRGVAQSGSDTTATEVQALVASSGVRLGDMRAVVADAVNETARMLGTVLFSASDMLGDVVLPAGGSGDLRFVSMGGDPLAGEAIDYAYEYGSESVERTDPAIEQKRTQDLIAQSVDPALGEKLAAEGYMLQTAPLVERLLKLTGEPNPDKYLTQVGAGGGAGGGAMDPAAVAADEDVTMAQSGEPLPVSPDDDHAAHLAVHTQDYEQSRAEAIAQHMAMHEQYLNTAGGGMSGGMVPPAAAGPAPGATPGATARTGTGGAARQAAALRTGAG